MHGIWWRGVAVLSFSWSSKVRGREFVDICQIPELAHEVSKVKGCARVFPILQGE